jgi:hypothetical protein
VTTKKKTSLTNSDPGEKRRLPRLQRADQESLPPLRLMARDVAIVETVYDCRAATTNHVATAHFSPTTLTKCDERLRKLYHHGFLLRTEQPSSVFEPNKPLVYWIDRRGLELLAQIRGVNPSEIHWNPNQHKVGNQFLYHLLDTNTVRIAIRKAAETHGYTIIDWKNEEILRAEHKNDIVTFINAQGNTQTTTVIPDDYFLLEKPLPEEHRSRILRLFVEIDRRTVTGEANTSSISQRDWAHKIRAYLAYFRSDAYIKRYGSTAGRVLIVTTGEKRAQHLREITEKNDGKAKFWFTTFSQVRPETILTTPIWTVASWESTYSLTDTKRQG